MNFLSQKLRQRDTKQRGFYVEKSAWCLGRDSVRALTCFRAPGLEPGNNRRPLLWNPLFAGHGGLGTLGLEQTLSPRAVSVLSRCFVDLGSFCKETMNSLRLRIDGCHRIR